jgi:Ni,Fe-hydrogenase III large subunit
VRSAEEYGDVHARFLVRVKEAYQSFRILNQVLALLPFETSALQVALGSVPANRLAIGMVEGWRGDIVTFVATGSDGTLSRVKVRDPSFINWQVVPHALLRQASGI